MKSTPSFLIATAFFLFLSVFSQAQVFTPRYNAINGNCGGYFEYLPQGYSSSSSQNYPVIIALHGLGELGNGGPSDLGNLLNCWTAIPRLIANGNFPNSFSVGGQSFSFIVICPQFKAWPSSSDVNDVFNYVTQNYHVDQSRIYVTGLSMGGGAAWTFAGDYPTKAAAVVPVCGAWSADAGRAQAIANAKLPIWATHNQDDPTVSVTNTTGWISMITQYGGNPLMTIFPVSGHDAWSKTYDPNFTQNGVNVYQWMLQHQKGGGSTPAPNQPPKVSTSGNQTITLPVNSVSLSGSASDADGSIASYQWSQLSGPSQASIASPAAASTAVNNLVQGTYSFRFTATDNQGALSSSDLTITVNPAPAPNQPPSVSTSGNQTITLPVNSVSLSGSASDPDGTIASYQWSQLSGPSQANITSPAAASTTVNNLVQGTYSFRFTATDNQGALSSSDLTITVNPTPNQPPVANAGTNQTITLPQSSIILVGSGFDPDGTISSYQWNEVSGPSQLTFGNASSAMCTVSNFQKGVYVLRFTVKDNQGATAWNEMTLTVLPPPNRPPVAAAGADQKITLPVNSVNLLGTASDPDGTVVSYSWTQTSGPTKTSFSSASPLALTVNNLEEGIYVFRLTVTDNDGATTWDEVKVTVLPDPRTVSTATVYPNPATNLINVKIDALTSQNNSVLRITNSAGTVVYTESFQRSGFTMIKQVDITKLSSGVYFLSVTSDINTVTTIKFVKQ